MGKSKKKENNKEKDIEKNKETKLSKKNIIIIVLAVLVVILLGIVGWFIFSNSQADKTTGSDWSDKYYEFLRNQNKNSDLIGVFLFYYNS